MPCSFKTCTHPTPLIVVTIQNGMLTNNANQLRCGGDTIQY
jgi:hypothetical protein